MSEQELWNELGNLYFLSGAYPQAVHAYNRSIQLDEAFGRPYSNLALTYVQQGRFQDAVDLYRRSLDLLVEDKERAISWNRLGDVYRHLKDYQQAVIAYRRADDLDPENGQARDQPGWISEPDRTREDEPARTARIPVREGDPWAGVTDGVPAEAQPVHITRELPTATWAPEDPTPYQQDMSDAPDPGALTTCGDPEREPDYPEADWDVDPETEIYVPDPENDDLSKWLPIPEEAPPAALEFYLDGLEYDAAEEPEPNSEDLGHPSDGGQAPIVPADAPQAPPEAPIPLQITALVSTRNSARTECKLLDEGKRAELDIIVNDRAAAEFVIASYTEPQPSMDHGRGVDEAQGVIETAAAEVIPVGSPVAVEPIRDAEEMREIEAGLAKFKRVVQINPRNANAWDALGNLYKTAGRYPEALLAYQQAITNDASKAIFHHHLGLVYACEGRIEEAIRAFERVIEIDPHHGLAHAALAGYYRKKGLEELAQKHVGMAMKNIFDSENEYNRACLAAICGNTNEALELLRVALENRQTYVDWILRDPDLDFIRQDPRFKQLISDYAQ